MAAAFHRDRGFTLVELLVVVTVILLLVSLALPLLRQARRASQSAACLSNLRQLAQGFHFYADAHDGLLPDESVGGSWDLLLQDHGIPEALFLCPGDTTVGGGVGLSYAWRDSFEVDVPTASLEGYPLGAVKATGLVLVFEDFADRHHDGALNAATVDAAARPWRLTEFHANLNRPVR